MSHRKKKAEDKAESNRRILKHFKKRLSNRRAELQAQIVEVNKLIEAINWKLT